VFSYVHSLTAQQADYRGTCYERLHPQLQETRGQDNAMNSASTGTDEFGTPYDHTVFPINNSAPEIKVDNVTVTESSAPPMTRAEYGKLRRKYFTKEFGKVKACGDKFHPTDEPHTNCESCWQAYFMLQDGIRNGVESVVRSFGIQQLKKVRGDNFTKMYVRFVATHPVQIRGDKVAA
jgi:hypothetical protein